MRFRIRSATAQDVERVFALERSVAEAPHWSREDYVAMVERSEAGPLWRCLVVAEDVVHEGFVALSGFAVGKVIEMSTGSVGELESVVVAEHARRMGLGRRLGEGVLEWCRGRGARAVELEVRSQNDSARSLYQAIGFVQEGLRRGYYRDPADDAVLMRIALDRDSTATR